MQILTMWNSKIFFENTFYVNVFADKEQSNSLLLALKRHKTKRAKMHFAKAG